MGADGSLRQVGSVDGWGQGQHAPVSGSVPPAREVFGGEPLPISLLKLHLSTQQPVPDGIAIAVAIGAPIDTAPCREPARYRIVE